MMLAIAYLNTNGYYATAESTYMIGGPVAVKPLETLLKKVNGQVAAADVAPRDGTR